MASVSVRYIVNDVDEAIAFYCQLLGFTEIVRPAPAFAMLARGDLRLVLSAPGGGPGGGQAMPDGTMPTPGGWNRFSLEVTDLEGLVGTLRARGTGSATRSSPASAAGRSTSRIPRATPWSCSSRPGTRPGCPRPPGDAGRRLAQPGGGPPAARTPAWRARPAGP